ncbi:unnamed protein product [Echinostoma caproni]|uniref:Plastocyanin-like domain-containing protein n=1 Tax=Echinostoma caproni TaxID=27848 RepID=A0A183BFP5_9TREM|nr:unnamed protein product [Echinostoma caproni]
MFHRHYHSTGFDQLDGHGGYWQFFLVLWPGGQKCWAAKPVSWAAPQTADVRLLIPDPVDLGLTNAWGLHPQWTIWHGQWLLGAAVSTTLTTCVRIPDQVEERTPCLIYKVL